MSSTIVTPADFDKASFGDVIRLGAPSGPSLTFVEKGLHVTSIAFKDKNGQEHDIIVGSDDPSHYVDEKKYRHCLVGRYCNRLPSDTPIQVGNQTITLPSHPAPGQSLHGGPGPNAWDDKVLNRVKLDEVKLFSPTEIEYLKEKEKASSAGVWTLTSPDGENGHAGTVLCEVAFVVVETPDEIGQVIAVYRAKLLDGEATALNLTQHWGFNLGASATSKGKPTPASKIGISDHHLKLKTKSILNLDAKYSLPTGTVLPLSSVDEKNFGGEGKTIGHAGKGYPSPSTTEDKMGQGFPGEGYDDFWVFDRAGRTDIAVPEESLSTLNVFKDIEKDSDTLATLSSPESGVSISFTSNQPGLQAWSGAGAFDGSDARKALHGGKSVRGQGDGYVSEAVPILAMEFHAIYGGWMHPELQKLGWDTILKKGEVYNNWVRMSIQA